MQWVGGMPKKVSGKINVRQNVPQLGLGREASLNCFRKAKNTCESWNVPDACL